MYEIKNPGPVALTDIFGDPVRDESGMPLIWDLKHFLLGRIIDPAFSEGKEGYEAAVLMLGTRAHIRAQPGGPLLLLEDEQYKRLRRAVARPAGGYDPRLAHCLVPFMQAVLDGCPADAPRPKEASPPS